MKGLAWMWFTHGIRNENEEFPINPLIPIFNQRKVMSSLVSSEIVRVDSFAGLGRHSSIFSESSFPFSAKGERVLCSVSKTALYSPSSSITWHIGCGLEQALETNQSYHCISLTLAFRISNFNFPHHSSIPKRNAKGCNTTQSVENMGELEDLEKHTHLKSNILIDLIPVWESTWNERM